ncbi:MAG: hypothetical protein GXY55_08780, partial [Phycisphaerae bacterium]|nr:hypothetical protein [Phycisphaerae bacterium]
MQAPPGEDPIDPSNEESLGWIIDYEYDWRSRQVVAKRYRGDDPDTPTLIGQTLTWYDNLDRVRIEAEYGAVLPTGVDPTVTPPAAPVPDVADLFGEPAPISVTEHIYNGRGLVQEVRTYSSAEDYTATLTFYDHADRPIEVHSPGAAIQRYEYDAKGRQILSRTIAGGVEVGRTLTKYDDNDRAIETIRYERRHDGTGETLDAANSVVSYQHTWYDSAGKVLATADYGTNTGSATDNGTYSNGTAPVYDAETLPDRTTASGEHITSYSYDGAGRQTVVVHPDGTETHYEYDGLERQILVIENATADESQPGEQRRRTAYFYECADAIPEQRCQGERLLKIAAVLPEHAGGVDKFSDIQWSAADGTLQVTEFVYGAEVVDQGGAGISRHNGWIAEVHYPDPATGQPIAAPSFAFTYYADGAVASRTDAKG